LATSTAAASLADKRRFYVSIHIVRGRLRAASSCLVGQDHGEWHSDQVNADLLAFIAKEQKQKA
jgi:hypothetical protein